MAIQKITEKQAAAAMQTLAKLLVVQTESQPGGGTAPSLRTATLEQLVATLKVIHPEVVKDIAPSENGLNLLFWDGTEKEIEVSTEGVAFDEVTVDQETGYLHFLKDGEDVVDPCYLGNIGGGGSGGGNNATISVSNTTGWLTKTVNSGAECPVSFTWSSLEDGMATGAGILTVRVNNEVKRTMDIAQGSVSLDIGNYLTAGTNKVRLTVSDVYENEKSLNLTVKAVDLRLASVFDVTGEFTAGAPVIYTYTPYGAVEKTVHFRLDGAELPTQSVAASGRQQSVTLPAMSHGSHSLLVWFTVSFEGEIVSSNELYYDIIVVGESNATIIASDFRRTAASQYETISIPYRVYTPNSLTSNVSLYANGTKISDVTADRGDHVWSYRADTTGTLELRIESGTASKAFTIAVADSDIDTEAETDSLVLHLNTIGRSNSEQNPGVWADTDNGISCTMTGFNYISNGWMQDTDNIPVLRVAGDARVTIPYKPFARDFRSSGKTIEIEFATRDVIDYDAVLVSCMSGGRGFRLTSQKAEIFSEQSSVFTQYKEDEHVRISFVAEKRAENRLLYIYINGIVSGVVQYAEDDDFSQPSPVNISIGSNDCGIDIYRIRIYDNNLTRHQILSNWIADTQDLNTLLERYHHNDVYDEYGVITIDKLPADLPYMVIRCAELPQYKGDKKTVSGYYVDPTDPSKSFTFQNCQANVQGTSSAPYARKNYDLQFKAGFDLATGHADDYALAENIVPFNRFVLKADVASSESANNVELVKLFLDANPYVRPETLEDPRVRQGIYGFPIVLFWEDTVGNRTLFMGKYNFNLPKRAPGPYGYSGNMESWEFQNNTSDLMLFRTDFFDETMYTDPTTGDAKELWRYDYEARFPSDEWTNYAKLQELESFVYSTWRERATGNNLPSSYTDADGNVHTKDNAAYRLAKFRTEFGKYAEVSSFIFYYIFTELFLMVDSRAKNLFIGFSGSPASGTTAIDRKAVAEPYDMDTAIGTNNEGSLVFGYSLEDTDHLSGGADVFNGQQSVLWNNIRDAFAVEIVQLYQTLRSQGILSYATVEGRFEDHQAKWSEAIFNDDAQFKYLDPLVNPDAGKQPTDVYLPMLQGSKAEQRKWWLYNRFRYMDSKWNAGDALVDVIQLRGYAKANITVTPYADIYPTIKYGSYLVSARGQHGQPTELVCPLDNVNDTEIYIYSAPQIASVGDLSGLKVGFADFSKATRLQAIKVGSNAAGYENENMTGLAVGTNALLGSIDARNCTALAGTVDFSGAANLEHVYLDGTAVASCSLPVGGVLKTLHLPATVTNLTIRDQTGITDFTMAGYANISTLRIENTPGIPLADILLAASSLNRVRIINAEWECDTAEHFAAIVARLKAAGGLDANGNNTDAAVVSGVVRIAESIDAETYTDCAENFPDLLIFADGIANCTVKFRNADGTLLYTESVAYGGNAIDPVLSGAIDTPVREGTGRVAYVFDGWDTPLSNITHNITIRATYSTTTAVIVTFKDWDGTVLFTETVAEGGNAYDPVAAGAITRPTRPATSEAAYVWIGWQQSLYNVTTDRDVIARYSEQPPVVVTFVNYGGAVLYTAYIVSGASAPDPVAAGLIQAPTREPDATYLYTFSGWNQSLENLTTDTTVTASYTSVQYYTATFKDADNNTLYAEKVAMNSRVLDPITEGWISTPTKTPEPTYNYIYKGWNTALSQNLTANVTYTAQFKTDRTFTVVFVDYDGTTVLDTQQVLDEEAALNPVTSGRIPTPARAPTAQYEYTWSGWNKTFASITADTTATATYTRQTRSYTVRFYDGNVLLDTVTVLYNNTANPSAAVQKSGVSDPENWILTEWNPVNTSIKADTDCYAVWDEMTIKDSWAEIFAAESDGTYSTKYAVGDTKMFVLGDSETVVMQIVAFDADELSTGGNAKITWISKYLLKTDHRMNPAKEAGTEGTGAIGGWEKCEMRSYLRETIFPAIPAAIRNNIKEVKKYSRIFDVSETSQNNVLTTDTVWIPSRFEVVDTSAYAETSGCHYRTSYYNSQDKKMKSKIGGNSASNWWIRSANNASSFIMIGTGGLSTNYAASYSEGVALGFCT